jgi:hypothetical protein
MNFALQKKKKKKEGVEPHGCCQAEIRDYECTSRSEFVNSEGGAKRSWQL